MACLSIDGSHLSLSLTIWWSLMCVVIIENFVFGKLELCFIHSRSHFILFVWHINCLVQSLFHWPLIQISVLTMIHEYFSCHTHRLFTVKRHSNWILALFLGIPNNCRIYHSSFSYLTSKYRFNLVSCWCREDSVWR